MYSPNDINKVIGIEKSFKWKSKAKGRKSIINMDPSDINNKFRGG